MELAHVGYTVHISELKDTSGSQATITALTKLVQEQLSSTTTQAQIEDAVNSPHTMVLIARDKDMTLIGTASAAMTSCPTGTRVHIEDVVVDQAWRGQGVATGLLKNVTQEAQERWHPKSIDLTSRPSRAKANALYPRLGFEQRNTHVYRYNSTLQ